MFAFNFRFAVLMSVVLSTGCATTYKPRIDNELRQSLSSAELVTFIPQEEIDLQFNPSNAGSAAGAQFGAIGGLIGAMVDASVNNSLANKAEQQIRPYRDKLAGYDFNGTHLGVLQDSIKQVEWIDISKLESSINEEDFTLKNYLPDIKHDALIVVSTNYSITPDLDVLNVNGSYALYKKPEEKGTKKPRFRPVADTAFQYQSPSKKQLQLALLPDFQAEKEAIENKYRELIESAQGNSRKNFYIKKQRKDLRKATAKAIRNSPVDYEWTQEQLEQELTKGINHVLTMMVMDMNDQRSAGQYEELKDKTPLINFSGQRSSATVYLIGNHEGHSIYRASNGTLYSVPEGDTLRHRAALQ